MHPDSEKDRSHVAGKPEYSAPYQRSFRDQAVWHRLRDYAEERRRRLETPHQNVFRKSDRARSHRRSDTESCQDAAVAELATVEGLQTE